MTARSSSISFTRIAVGAAVAALLLTACGTDAVNDSGSDDADAVAEDTEPEGGEEPDAGDDSAACVDAATEHVEAAREPIAAVVPTAPIDMSANEGASVWAILGLSTELLANIGAGFAEAASEVGMEATVFDGQGQVNVWNQGIEQAVAQGADGIQLVGIDPTLVAESLASAEEAGIPVIASNSNDPDEDVPDGLVATLAHDDYESGRTMAANALATNGCEGDILYATSSLYHVLNLQADGFRSMVEELCDTCAIEELDVDLTTAAADLAPEVSTTMRRNPDITYAVASIDFLVPFMLSGIEEVTPDVPLMGSDGTTAALDLLRAGELDADMAFPPNEFVGWLGIDALGRILQDEPVDQRTFVSQFVDEENIGDTIDEIFPNWVGYKDEYRAAWGL